jgi:hypothetical protein
MTWAMTTEDKDTQQGPTLNTNGEPLFCDVLLAAQRQWHSHRIDTHRDKEDRMLCEAWLHIGQDPICGTAKGRILWEEDWVVFP